MLNDNIYNESEEVILQKLAAGDEHAFTLLYNQYQPLITRILYPFNPPVEPPEIVQDIFYKIWLKRELMTEVKSFKNYLLRMVKNRLIDRNKTFKTRQKYYAHYADTIKTDFHSGNDEILFNELQERTAKAINRLPERQKKILQLTMLEDYSRDEIAAILNISVWVVDKDLGQATKTIKNLVNPG